VNERDAEGQQVPPPGFDFPPLTLQKHRERAGADGLLSEVSAGLLPVRYEETADLTN